MKVLKHNNRLGRTLFAILTSAPLFMSITNILLLLNLQT
jgi:hypothetical protein